MKKNLTFMGVMAVILMSSGIAAAATTQVASRAYVDQMSKTKSDVTFVGTPTELSATGVTAKTIVGAIGELKDATDSLPTEGNFEQMNQKLEGKADKLNMTDKTVNGIATVDAAGQYQVSETTLDSLATAESVTNLTSQVNANATTITNMPTTLPQNETFVTAITGALDLDAKADKLTTGNFTIGNIVTVGENGQYVDGGVTPDSLKTDVSDKANLVKNVTTAGHVATIDTSGQYVESDVALSDLATTTDLNGVEKTENRVATINAAALANGANVYPTVNAVVGYVVPQPESGLNCETELCVLTTDNVGNLKWVQVTTPVNEVVSE